MLFVEVFIALCVCDIHALLWELTQAQIRGASEDSLSTAQYNSHLDIKEKLNVGIYEPKCCEENSLH